MIAAGWMGEYIFIRYYCRFVMCAAVQVSKSEHKSSGLLDVTTPRPTSSCPTHPRECRRILQICISRPWQSWECCIFHCSSCGNDSYSSCWSWLGNTVATSLGCPPSTAAIGSGALDTSRYPQGSQSWWSSLLKWRNFSEMVSDRKLGIPKSSFQGLQAPIRFHRAQWLDHRTDNAKALGPTPIEQGFFFWLL